MAKRINKLRKHFVIKTLEDGKCLITKQFLETYVTLDGLPREVTQKIMSYVPIRWFNGTGHTGPSEFCATSI